MSKVILKFGLGCLFFLVVPVAAMVPVELGLVDKDAIGPFMKASLLVSICCLLLMLMAGAVAVYLEETKDPDE